MLDASPTLYRRVFPKKAAYKSTDTIVSRYQFPQTIQSFNMQCLQVFVVALLAVGCLNTATVLGDAGVSSLRLILESASNGTTALEALLNEAGYEDGVLATTLRSFRKIDDTTVPTHYEMQEVFTLYLQKHTEESKSIIESFIREVPELCVGDLIQSVTVLDHVVSDVLLTGTSDRNLASVAMAVSQLVSTVASAERRLVSLRTPIANEVIDALTVTLQSLVAGVAGIIDEIFADVYAELGLVAQGLVDILSVVLLDTSALLQQIFESFMDSINVTSAVSKDIQALKEAIEEPAKVIASYAFGEEM